MERANTTFFHWCENHKLTLRKLCKNTGFLWPVFSRIRTKYTILSLYERIRVSENPYSCIFYAVCSHVYVIIFVVDHVGDRGSVKCKNLENALIDYDSKEKLVNLTLFRLGGPLSYPLPLFLFSYYDIFITAMLLKLWDF